MTNRHIAMFIDHDNVQLRTQHQEFTHCGASRMLIGPIVRKIETNMEGSVDIRRCYGNTMLHSSYALRSVYNGRELRRAISQDVALQQELLDHGFSMVHTPPTGDKNRADILMALDCLEIATAYTGIDTFVLLSHDTDFAPLVHRLRAMGKEVVLVSVGSPGRSFRSLSGMASAVLSYDQALIDAAGFDLLAAVLDELAQEEGAPLEQGVDLASLHARMTARAPWFSYEALGFAKFSAFVSACIDAPLVRRGNRLRQVAPQTEPQAPPEQFDPREATLSTALRKQGLMSHPELRYALAQWLQHTHFEAGGRPCSEQTAHQLLLAATEHFYEPESCSRSQIRYAFQVLARSGVVEVEPVEGKALGYGQVLSMRLDASAGLQMVRFLVAQLESTGIVLLPGDVPALGRIIFGTDTPPFLELIRQGIALHHEE